VRSVSYGVLRFVGYEESRKLFEETARMSTAEALVGRDELVAKLSDLVAKYGMQRSDDMEWKPDRMDLVSLDGFCG
jgi:hypothetical protein